MGETVKKKENEGGESEMWSGKEEFDDAEEVLDEDAERKRDERHYYRDLILRSVATLGIVMLPSAAMIAGEQPSTVRVKPSGRA